MLIEDMTAVEIFNGKNVDAVLEGIKSKARAEAAKLDISTPSGREAIASLAHKVARTKTGIDDEGKALVEGEKKRLSLIDADRKRYRDELDALKAEVRKPLTDWENAEKSRVAAHEAALEEMESLGRLPSLYTVADAENAILSLKAYSERDWQEFEFRAKQGMGATFLALKRALEAARKAEAERVELERLRAEQAAREQQERDERIAREAADRERKLAEAREQEAARVAEAERLRVERERNEAEAKAKQAEAARVQAIKDAEERAERERQATVERERVAAERAEAAKKAAVDAERKRAEDARAAEQREAEARERNKAHVAKINKEVLSDLTRLTVPTELAEAIIAAIAKGSVAHTKIIY